MTRVYIVGGGVIARAHAHGARLVVPQLELHVTEPNPTALKLFLDENPDAQSHASLAKMLTHQPARATDIVIVATPPWTHRDLTLEAIASGRSVLCEKPLAMNIADARQMLAAAKAAGVHLGDCSMRFFGYGAGEALKSELAAGKLGQLYHITSRHLIQRGRSGVEYQPETRWFLDRAKAGGGVLYDWAVYDLSTLFDVVRPSAVRVHHAWTARPTTQIDPTDVAIDVEHAVGAAMSLRIGNRWVPFTYERASITHGTEVLLMELEGTTGAATWQWLPWTDDETSVTMSHDDRGKIERQTLGFTSAGETNFHHRPLKYFHELLLGKDSLALVNEAALSYFEVIDAIYASARDDAPREIEIQY
ncbi:Gfo/Idh/MocA family protein [Devosia sp.]|jgi:predicted dehydrogenase|uniref:Gfo/Idh/MocA family protein n=1 Tax=Devosia sp. TaxID=1871048 RepID=UPI0037BE9900